MEVERRPVADGALSAALRVAFESWISQMPYERSVDRWPDNEIEFAWPGQYKDISVQLAWEAWQEGRKL